MSSIRKYILSNVEHSYNLDKLSLNESEETILSDFINNSQTLLLQFVKESEKELKLYTDIQNLGVKTICFYKSTATELTTESSLKYINIVTLANNPLESFYHIIKTIFLPLLSAFPSNELHFNKLQKNLTDLESILRIISYGKSDVNTNVIFTIEDELQYWKNLGDKKETSRKEKEAAANFSELFNDIIEEIREMHSAPMSEIREAVENIGGLLDDVWRYTLTLYPQDRMIHVFDIIGHGICMIIQNVCSSYNLWVVENESEEHDILNLLCESLKVMCTWTSACESLTETYWPNYALHPWIGKSYVPSFCSNFEVRLKKIYNMRSTYSQLFKLLTINERSELKIYTLFDAFKEVNVWLCNGQNNSWEVAATRFSASLRPAETKIAEKLKPRFHNTSTKQMLYEFMRYQSLIQSPYVKQALNTELEIFVSSLLTMLKSIQEQLDADELNVNLYKPPEMSTVVHQVQWAKQMESKVKEIHDCADKNLKDFDGCNELLNLSNLLLKQLKQVYTQLYEEWCRDLQAQAKNGALSLSMDKPVVEFSNTSKLMVVNFNPKLVWAELETRALIALGFPAPSFTASLDTLQKTLTHARALQQVASFHNTLGERMIPSTRPMMLQAALDLSALVQNQEAVYWDDIEQLTNYTDKLREMVFKLETQNTYLTSQHMAIRGIVEKLLDTELLAKQAEWKKSVKQIRDIIEMVENNGYKNTELWRSHWDWQLYKVLECQYIITLQSLHKHFPHFRVDLLLRGHMVRVQPPMEEVRVQHYHQLRRLVSIPANFVGVQSNLTQNDSIFSAIVEKHSWLGNKAVAQIEATLSSLERLCKDWTKRAALACVEDLEALCKEHLHDPRDWELNFKACKAYGQAVAKMTFEDEKIEWITVGTVTLRREFEAQTRTLWSCLMSTLQSSCLTDAADINAFVANARIMLENKTLPQNSKELTEFSLKQQALQANMPEMETTVENLKKKSHMLRTWGGDIIVDGTIKEWKKIHEMLVGQQQLFEHQAEIVKSGLSGEWSNLNTTVEAWASRWTQTKLRYEEVNGASYDEIVDRCRSVYDGYAQWEKYLNDRDDLIKECKQFNIKVEQEDIWRDTEKLMDEFMNTWSGLKEYNEEYESIVEQEWIVFQKKLHLLDELVCKWKNRLEPYTMVTLYIQQELEKYTDLSLSLKYLRGTDFTERHWREVFNLLDIEYKKPDTLLVKDLLAASINIKKHVKELQKICTSASSESAIRSALNELELWYAGARFSITYFNNKPQKQTPIVKDFKDILSKIEEQQWVVSSVSGGDAACGTWEARLRAARALVRALYHAQRRWLYLEPILSVDEGELGNKFKKVDQGFRQVTRIVESDPRLSALLHTSRVQAMLDSISEQLHACQSGLNKYIDDKRTIFPRFYFLSDDDLLELLGQARAGVEGRHAVMQTHLKKLFPGITSVRLGPGDTSITALCSHFGEIFKLEQPVDIDCPVELWLKRLEIEMRSSLKMMTLKCIAPNSLQEQDPFTLPTQILCLTQNIRFTKQVERAIVSKDLHTLKANVEKEHLSYAAAEVDDEGEQQKRQALILQCTHYMGVIRTLIDSNVTSVNDWLWQKQLRFYLVNSEDVIAKMGLAQISYSYEYLGVNTGHFVRTELADECFLILTQSLQLGFVGNPFGPAGTGKTESVKALGGLFGRLVLIFNCDEAMDSECMGRLLTGLALSGAWGCFDEFNRLAGDTLAALSHQLASLLSATQQGKRGQEPSALLNGRQISVSEWCGVAATMNPAGRGYGGRRQLPAALESVLRPIAMVQPRGDQLSSHLLAARCIPHSDVLARDLHNVFVMAEALLSGQRHYDWGLRALKAAVGSCGTALAGMPQKKELPQLKAVIRHVLALNNISKLTTIDAERFKNILSLVFGHDTLENITDNTINLELQAAAQNLEFIPNDLQRQKCVELYEQLQQRMGVVIVGPPGSGKTTIRKILKSALIRQGKSIMEYVICPKAMSRDWLLGNIDHDTRQWTDGVISTTALEISNQQPDITSWVVCDGDIDPEWIEALNSVLDENRLLTLPSGWRIQFGSNVNFIFETHSLEHASPATVSRMGIILFSDDISCHADVVENWIRKVDVESNLLQSTIPLLQRVIEMSIQWISGHRSDAIIKVNNVALVRNILTQFEYIVQNVTHSSGTISEELVYLAVERSLLGILKENAVGRFHEELSNILGPCVPSPLLHGEWVSDNLFMSPRLSAIEPILRACFSSNNSHSLIIGPEGSAKSILAEYIVKDSNSNVITIVCTPILEPSDIIAELKRNNLIQSSGAGGARVTLLVRALHRARVDSWGSSPVQNFLLQLIHHGGFWNRDSEEENCGTQWSYISRVRVVAIANNASMLSPRLVAAFAQCTVPEPDDDEVLELTTHCLRNCVDKNLKNNEQIPNVSRNVLSFFKEVTETFYSRLHYKWNVSHLKKCCINVKWYSPSDVDELVMAIIGEVNSVFKDGLVSEDEKSEFISLVKKHFKCNNLAIYYMCKLKADGVYMESVEYNVWYQITEKLINQCLSEHEYNVFGDTCAEVCSELAVLCPAVARTANGELLTCIGNAGCGRRAAAVISSASLPSTLIFINHTSQFNPQMKNAISSSGEGTRTITVICEPAVTVETLAYVEALKHAHSIHAIPTAIMPNSNTPNLLQNVKQNLGIMICLDKTQENLHDLLEKFPIIYNDGHLVWLDRISDSSLRELPPLIIQRLTKENMLDMPKEELSDVPVYGFVNIFNNLDVEQMRAPCKYYKFVKTYYHIISTKKASLTKRQKTLSAGVDALCRARSEVKTLQEDAAQQSTALADKRAKANQALDQIGATVQATTDKKEEMHLLKKNIEIENEKLQQQKKEIEAELASVEPVIAAARAAVGDIRPESLSEIRSLRAPPDVVRDVLEGVLRLMGIADTSWHSMKNFLSKRGVKEDIRCMDASQISESAVESVGRLLERRRASFEPSAARRASAACAPLAAWVLANLRHAHALANVRPLQAQQAKLHKSLEEAENQLSALSSGLATVDERVAALKEQLGQHTRDAATIELSLTNATNTIQAAKQLLDQLAHEYDTWENDLDNISKEITDLKPRSLLAAAYIIYLPEVTEPQARDILNNWQKIIEYEDATFSANNFLSSIEKQLKWDADGLPSDHSAIKNAVLVDQILEANCGFTPLIVDPDGDGINWLRNTLANVQCEFVSQQSEKLQTAVQYAVRLGKILVITDVDTVHECWSTLLYGLPVSASSMSAPITVKLILHCRDETLPSRLPPNYAARISILHFTARLDGLTDQLVYFALQQQNPEITEKTKEIKLKKVTLQKQQHELQEHLLRDLSSNSDILHDANLLASLNKTRTTNATIIEALQAALTIEESNRAACEVYSTSARRLATLALAVRRLGGKRSFVTLPVDAILDIYVDALRTVGDRSRTNDEELLKYVTRRVIERVLLGLHKKDKYIIVLYLLKEAYEDMFPEELWRLLIKSDDFMDDLSNIQEIKQSYQWVHNDCLKKIANLKVINKNLFDKLSLDKADMWKDYLKHGDVNILSGLKLTPFEIVVVVSVIRPDSTYRTIVSFVEQMLGVGAVWGGDAVGVAARGARAARGRRGRPLLVRGAHAAALLAAHAHANNRAFTQVGVEEGRSAWESALEKGRLGGWVALVVGASPFTPQLQTFIVAFSEISTEEFDEEFRLWIVSEDRDIPPLISNACVNVVLESPEGVKNNVMGTLSAWGNYEGDPKTMRLHACLALFHALVQERRAYIPQGWSRWYAWEWGEVQACAGALRGGGGGGQAPLWLALYGARVNAAADRRVLTALHAACLNPARVSITLPHTPRLQDYTSAFNGLPDIDSPQLLGLPANCRIAWEKNAANSILTGLKELNSTVSVTQNNLSNAPMKALLGLWKKLMSGSPLIKADYQIPTAQSGGWWGCVCGAEAAEARRGAAALHAALAGARARRHPMHAVPDEWQLLWAGPDAPDAYLKEFCFRAKAAVARLETTDFHSDYMPSEVDLRCFLRPARVIWALRVRTALRLSCPVDSLALIVKWNCLKGASGGDGSLVVTGLRLSGGRAGAEAGVGARGRGREEAAGASAAALSAAEGSSPPHAPAPPLLLTYLPQHANSPLISESSIDVPVYTNELREEIVFYARTQLAHDFDRDTALLNAIALFIAPIE